LLLAVGSKSPDDRRISARWISKRIGRLMADAGIHRPGDRRTAHALRHTAASDVLDRCHDVRTVQQMLGHASLQSTEVYLRRADLNRLRRAMSGRVYVA
jgi:integrase